MKSLWGRFFRKYNRDGIYRTFLDLLAYPISLKRRKTYSTMLRKEQIADRFSCIYENNLWNSNESLSGEGSEISYTYNLRSWLEKNLPSLNVKVFVDAPCGDFNWMRAVLPNVDVMYIGIDIVPSVVMRNISLYSTEKINFRNGNICEDLLPACDMIMVRDCLFHLSYKDINRFLINLSRTEYKYLLTTTHIVGADFKNSDITSGDFRLIDLFSAPFGFEKAHVIDAIDDYPNGHRIKRNIVLIEKKYVPKKLTLI